MGAAPLFTDIADAPDGGQAHFTEAKDGTRIRFAIWAGGERGTVVLLPGRSEYIEKYGRVVTALAERGFSSVVIDWRGQGLSDRIGERTDLGDVVRFSDYQQDLNAVLEQDAVKALARPRILFSHSMGGCIALRHLLNDHTFKAAVFSAPMWHLTLPEHKVTTLKVLSRLVRGVGLGRMRVPSTNGNFYVATEGFADNNLTTDPDHWHYMRQQIMAQPALGLGGPSLRWLRGAFDEFAAFENSEMPEMPVLMMLGTDEEIVSPEAIQRLSKRFPNGSLEVFDTARHEIFMEAPGIQVPAWQAIDRFLAELV